MEDIVDYKISQYEKMFEEKTKVLDSIFATLFDKQQELERLSDIKHDETIHLIDEKNEVTSSSNEKLLRSSRKMIERKGFCISFDQKESMKLFLHDIFPPSKYDSSLNLICRYH